MFKDILKNYHITQKELAKTLNCNQPLISKWCTGRGVPTINAVIKISDAYNIPIEEIVLAFKKEQKEEVA